MRLTIAVRADKALRDAVAERAAAQGKTVSAFVRELLEQAITDRPLHTRAGYLRGGLRLHQDPDGGWRRHLRERNWRPTPATRAPRGVAAPLKEERERR